MDQITADRLIDACGDEGMDAGITIRTDLVPLGGPNAKVKPAVYVGGVFQQGRRWWGEGPDRSVVDVITIDNEPSQANRLEAALERLRPELGLPELVLDLTSLEPMPPHVPRRLSSFRFPHRNADAYLRDAMLDDEDFLKSDIGRAIFSATIDNADAPMAWFPQALLFGFWQSHLGKKGSQAKAARSWVSEIIGIDPASDEVRTLGLKGDPLNLSVPGKVSYDENQHAHWSLTDKGKNLSDIGHGQVPVGGEDGALAGVSFRTVVQQSTVSFASLRRVHTAQPAEAEARAVLVALGLLAHTAAFGRGFNLRSGCDLRPLSSSWTWLGASADEPLAPLDIAEAKELFSAVVTRAENAGVAVGKRWSGPVILTPKKALAEVIRKTYPAPEEA